MRMNRFPVDKSQTIARNIQKTLRFRRQILRAKSFDWGWDEPGQPGNLVHLAKGHQSGLIQLHGFAVEFSEPSIDAQDLKVVARLSADYLCCRFDDDSVIQTDFHCAMDSFHVNWRVILECLLLLWEFFSVSYRSGDNLSNLVCNGEDVKMAMCCEKRLKLYKKNWGFVRYGKFIGLTLWLWNPCLTWPNLTFGWCLLWSCYRCEFFGASFNGNMTNKRIKILKKTSSFKLQWVNRFIESQLQVPCWAYCPSVSLNSHAMRNR